ncbi:putative metal-dependent hydrolase YcfH [termite gut metagenome]|uniref:Putative metal-dependent hydrolase YcfH n=1 Tax=termite gut metagenome TaxID=433724 RepID=A0A5J4RLV2_9ZZZZ
MKFVDSHSHLFLEEFADDLPAVIDRAKAAGVSHIFMPNIDSSTIKNLLQVCDSYKNYCYPMIGLHPTSVNLFYKKELDMVAEQLDSSNGYVAIGEVGIDLYWDKTYLQEQLIAFDKQVQWALTYQLPVVIHCRNAFEQIYETLYPYRNTSLRGIFHCFTGTEEEAGKILSDFPGFMIGFNGVITFKNSSLSMVFKQISLERIVVETDSPYLAPVPYRGQRNESAYLKDILMRMAEIRQISPEEIARVTSENALNIFKIS